jgi:ssDNA-specific exonuclease RecJ
LKRLSERLHQHENGNNQIRKPVFLVKESKKQASEFIVLPTHNPDSPYTRVVHNMPFKVPVSFLIFDNNDPTRIYLSIQDDSRFLISGFPRCILKTDNLSGRK